MGSLARRFRLARAIAACAASPIDRVRLLVWSIYMTVRERMPVLPLVSITPSLSFGQDTRPVMLCNLSDLWVIKDVLLDKEYEMQDEDDAKIIIDLGCNIGISTLFLASRYPHAKIYAIEPNPVLDAQLSYNLRGLADISHFALALGATDGPISLHVGTYSTGATITAKKGSRIVEVEGVSANNLLARLSLTQADIIKFDIEGAEQYLFRDLVRFESIRAYIGEAHYDRMPVTPEEVHARFAAYRIEERSAGRADRAILYMHKK